MNNEKILHDCKQNKVKEGPLLKQSRHIKQWKERWMVLTKTHLYSFSTKGQYKDPTQCVHLKDIETFKSYFKDQYKKQYTFRVQSQEVKLHMSAKSSEQKVAWMTAIQKTIQRLIHGNSEKHDHTFAFIRETLRMAPAIRQTLAIKQINKKQNIDFSDDLIKKMKLNIESQTIFYQVMPHVLKEAIRSNQQNKDKGPQTSFTVKKQEKLGIKLDIKQQDQDQQEQQEQETFFILEKKKPKQKAAKVILPQKNLQNNKNQSLEHNHKNQDSKQLKVQQKIKVDQVTPSKTTEAQQLKKNQQISIQQQIHEPNDQIVNEQNIEIKTKTEVEGNTLNQKAENIVQNHVSNQKAENNEEDDTQKVELNVQKAENIVQDNVSNQKVEKNEQNITSNQRVVYKIIQKIVTVPEIKEIFVQKIVYKQSGKNDSNNLINVLKELMMNPGQNPTPLINFVVYLLTTDQDKFHPQVLQFCLDSQTRRFFSQVFLLLINQEIQQQNLNSYLQFILKLYEACDDYFYTSDIKALVTILLRQMEMNRSQLNQHLIMLVFQCFAQKQWWGDLNYRVNQIRAYVQEINSISGQQNRVLSARLLQKL